MPHFLYLSDVFCPWCYGFAPVMQRLAAEHPELPVRVLGGDLMDEPTTLAEMKAHSPNIRDFFIRLAKTTARPVDGFLATLDAERPLRMYSPDMAVLLAALKRLAPGHELAQIEILQQILYGAGRDVFSAEVREEMATRWQVDPIRLERALADPAVREEAGKETREAAALMGEFKLYPTLYLVKGDERRLLARGYASYSSVSARLAAALSGNSDGFASGGACSLDGACDA